MIHMSLPADLTIERTTDVDIDADELWKLVSTAEGWSSWLVDDADIDVVPGADGNVRGDGIERRVRIESIDIGRGVDFAWWDRDDPSSASYVRLDIVELPNGRARLHVTERFIGATGSASLSSSVETMWEVRFVSLWLLALHSTVMA
jgi:uncharacterized protein YndB with AHSA1/START domain